MQFLQCSFVECSFVYLFFSLRAVCSPLGRIYNIATNVSFVSCSFLRCFRCSFPCVFSLVYIVIVFVRCFICSFNRTVSFRSALKIALELVSISRQWHLQILYNINWLQFSYGLDHYCSNQEHILYHCGCTTCFTTSKQLWYFYPQRQTQLH